MSGGGEPYMGRRALSGGGEHWFYKLFYDFMNCKFRYKIYLINKLPPIGNALKLKL